MELAVGAFAHMDSGSGSNNYMRGGLFNGDLIMKVKYLVSALSENNYIWLRAYDSRAKSWHALLCADAAYMKQLVKSGDKRLDLKVGEWRAVPFNGEIAIEIYAKQRATGHGRRGTQKAVGRLCRIK